MDRLNHLLCPLPQPGEADRPCEWRTTKRTATQCRKALEKHVHRDHL